MDFRRFAASALAVIAVAGCIPEQSTPATASPTVRPTSARPKFELATYMYALQTRGKIRIGVLDNAPPFSERGSGGSYTGFEPDLGRELAKAIFGPQQNVDTMIEWVSVDSSTGVSALTSAQADVVLARLTPSDERTAAIDLSEGYFVTGERILVRADNDAIKDLSDLDTMTVCVQGDESPTATHVTDANPGARTLGLDTYLSCLGALRRGQVDAIGAGEATLWELMKQDPATKLVGRPLTVERYAVGAKKNTGGDRQGFLPFLNAWLLDLIRAGTWGRLYTQDVTPLSRESRTGPVP